MRHSMLAVASLVLLGCCQQQTGSAAPQTAPPSPSDMAAKYVTNVLTGLADEAAVAHVMPRWQEFHDAFRDEQARQIAGWSFAAHRWGDFLTLDIRRGGNAAANRYFSTTINLAATTRMDLVPGHAPDLGGEVSYTFDCELNPGVSGVTDTGSMNQEQMDLYQRACFDGLAMPPAGYHFTVIPHLPPMPGDHVFVYGPSPPVSAAYDGTYNVAVGYGMSITLGGDLATIVDNPTRNFPRAAQDDAVVFEGINFTLYAPAGLGAGVRDAILHEMQRGYGGAADGK